MTYYYMPLVAYAVCGLPGFIMLCTNTDLVPLTKPKGIADAFCSVFYATWPMFPVIALIDYLT